MPPLPNSSVQGWETSPEVEKWARRNRFSESRPATDRELRDFSRDHGGEAPGLYLWEDEEHHIYIGISEKHVGTRLRSHIRNFRPVSNIQSFRYREDSSGSRELRELERQLVHSAAQNSANFVVMNREHAAVVFGDSEFDAVVSPAEQEAWLENPAVDWKRFTRTRSVSQSEAAKNAWRKFEDRNDADKIVEAVALYARLCVPHASDTEYEWWVVTCPGWKKAGFSRVCTVSISYLEVLWFAEDLQTGRVSVRVGVDYRSLPAKVGTNKLRMDLLGKVHPSGGPFEEVVGFESVDDFIHALGGSAVLRRGAARFALDRMRTGRVGRYKESHSPQLAEAALLRAAKLKVAKVEDETTVTRLAGSLAAIKRRRRQ